LDQAIKECIRNANVFRRIKTLEKSAKDATAQAAYGGSIMERPARDFLDQTKALAMAVAGDHLDLFACHAIAADWHEKTDTPQQWNTMVSGWYFWILDATGSTPYAGSSGTLKTGAMPSLTH
jgi:hypothetical protein